VVVTPPTDAGGNPGTSGGPTGGGGTSHSPEPATLLSGLIGAACVCLGGWLRRRQMTPVV
jgi:hypothetical protein